MAKTKQWKPKRVRSEEERGGGKSDYLRLDEGQKFTGYALFDGDPAADEPGYYEYLEHFDPAARRSIPCAGDDCPLCEDGDKPKTRAKTLWLVTKDEKGDDLGDGELKIFQANWNIIKFLTDMRTEGDKIKGVLFRVTRIDDRGNYALLPKSDKLTASQVKELLKSKDAPDFDAMVTATLNRAMEGYSVRRALDDDEEEDEEKPKPTSAKKKAKTEEPDEGAEWPEEGEDVVATVTEVDGETITVTSDDYEGEAVIWSSDEYDLSELDEGATITISWVTDDADDKVVTAFEANDDESEAEDGDGDGDGTSNSVGLPDSIDGEEFEVVGEVDEQDGCFEVKSDDLDLQFDLYVLDGVDIDWDDYPVGAKIIVNAEKDVAGDMVSNEAPELVKKKSTRSGGGSKKSSSKKASAKKSDSKKKASAKKGGKRK